MATRALRVYADGGFWYYHEGVCATIRIESGFYAEQSGQYVQVDDPQACCNGCSTSIMPRPTPRHVCADIPTCHLSTGECRYAMDGEDY